MANERVITQRNIGTTESPQYAKYFIKTLAECVLMSDADGETKTIKDYVDDAIKKLVNGAPEELDTLKEIADAIASNQTVVDAINASITNKVDKVSGKGLSTNDFTSAEKTKLAGIAEGANKYVLPAATASALGGVKSGTDIAVDSLGNMTVKDNSHNHTVANVTGLQTALDGKAAKTHTHAIADVTNLQSTLDSKAANTDMGAATASAAGTHGLVPAPAAGKQGAFLRGDGTWTTPANTTYTVATTSANGLMSSADKSKLDGIAANANNYVHPTTSGNKHIPTGGAANQVLEYSADGTAKWGHKVQSDVPANAKFTDTTYSAATASAAGLMSAADKAKLDATPKVIFSATEPEDAPPGSIWMQITE